ncbi:MAG: hypothetical protein Q9217_000652 [Psora testacea]
MVDPRSYATYELGNVILDEARCGCGVYTEERTGKAMVIRCNMHHRSWRRLKHSWPSKTHNEILKAVENKKIAPPIQSRSRIHSKSDPCLLRELVGRALDKANQSPRKTRPYFSHSRVPLKFFFLLFSKGGIIPNEYDHAPTKIPRGTAPSYDGTSIQSVEPPFSESPAQPRSILENSDLDTFDYPINDGTWISHAMQSNTIRKRLRRPSDKVSRGVPRTPGTSPSRQLGSKYYVACPSHKLVGVSSNELSGVPGVPKDEIDTVPKRSSSSEGPRPPPPPVAATSQSPNGREDKEEAGAARRLDSLRRGYGRSLEWLAEKLRPDTDVDPNPYTSPLQSP